MFNFEKKLMKDNILELLTWGEVIWWREYSMYGGGIYGGGMIWRPAHVSKTDVLKETRQCIKTRVGAVY